MNRDPKDHFTREAARYDRYVSAFWYPEGIRAYFERAAWLCSDLHILDAGCGSGLPGLALLDAIERRGLEHGGVHAFDLTPAMLDRYRVRLARRRVDRVELREANVLELERLPASWTNYDRILAASMLEYIPTERLAETLAALRSRLTPGGRLVVFMTRRSAVTRMLVERPWGGNRYTRSELAEAFASAGFRDAMLGRFPVRYAWLNRWGHIMEGLL
jgi:cyclopropane fatty-acyl-phospholipid synthase-like methyltransferase